MTTVVKNTTTSSASVADSGTTDTLLASYKKLKEENWGSPIMILVVVAIITLIIAFIIFYSVGSTLFATSGTLAGLGWISAGGGALFFFIMGVFITACAGALSLAWKENGKAMFMAFVIPVVLGILLYFIVASVRDDKKDLFILWSALYFVLGLGVAGYGYWSLHQMAKANPTEGNLESLKKWTLGSLIVAIISFFAGLFALFGVYGTFD